MIAFSKEIQPLVKTFSSATVTRLSQDNYDVSINGDSKRTLTMCIRLHLKLFYSSSVAACCF